MAQRGEQEELLPEMNSFYRRYYYHVIIMLMVLILLMTFAVGFVLYQMFNRPLPEFNAIQPDGKKMQLAAFKEPNLLPDTIIQWASKGAVLAYTFDFYNYPAQQAAARPYFTEGGWNDYLNSVKTVIDNVVANKLIVNSVVAGTAVISNEGDLVDKGYTWRVQIPFLVTYQGANSAPTRYFYVTVTIVRVPTSINPQGIGIDQFVMSSRA